MNTLAEDRERLEKDKAEIDAAKQELVDALSSGGVGVSQAARVFSTVDSVTERQMLNSTPYSTRPTTPSISNTHAWPQALVSPAAAFSCLLL